MKQSNDSEAFFKKYGFTKSSTIPHPVYNDLMYFEGLEADYVSRLEIDVEHYKRCLLDAMQNNERLMHKEFWRLKDENEKLKLEAQEK